MACCRLALPISLKRSQKFMPCFQGGRNMPRSRAKPSQAQGRLKGAIYSDSSKSTYTHRRVETSSYHLPVACQMPAATNCGTSALKLRVSGNSSLVPALPCSNSAIDDDGKKCCDDRAHDKLEKEWNVEHPKELHHANPVLTHLGPNKRSRVWETFRRALWRDAWNIRPPL